MIGTRGIPASYGGFETAIEEIGRRLADRGHEITVYCRNTGDGSPRPSEYLGMKLVHLPAIRQKALETLSHTALSVVHAATRELPDAAFVFNAANAPFIPWLHLRGIPTAVHVDGLEWQRGKWGPTGRRYYRWAERFSVRQADALIADAQGIVDYYDQEFQVATELIRYGTRILRDAPSDRLGELDLEPGGFHLVVARFEPENHVDVIVEGYLASSARLPLVVVGSAPYAAAYTTHIAERAASDPRVRLVGGVWDQDLLDQLYAHAVTYLHGHSVGGTNPSLLRAMGAGTAVIAWDVVFNREVLGATGAFFSSAASLAPLIEDAEFAPHRTAELGDASRSRAEQQYDWNDVADGYEALAVRLAGGYSTRGTRRDRNPTTTWTLGSETQAMLPAPSKARGGKAS